MFNNKKIHLNQQLELYWIAFFIWNLIQFCIRLIQYRNPYKANANTSFEKEAYFNEHKFNNLQHQKSFCFLKYL